LTALAAKPADPSANLAVGEYECFVKGDWPKGLPRLAASSDEALQRLAKLDLSNPTAAAERMAIGNGWWDLAEARQQHRDALRQRAAHWYRPIESALVGIDQANVRKRLAQLDGTAEPASTASTSKSPDAAGRQVLLREQGGNEASEAAVERALDWLARHQNPDGSWSFNHVRPACKEQCPDAGTLDAPQGATSLALLPFLGAGHSHRADSRSKYRSTVSAALNYLRMNLARVGGLFDNDQGMPSHAWGTIALCEASEGGRDKSSRAAAVAAIELIVNTQNADGGWSMLPRPGAQPNPSELATTAWNVVALKTAQAAGIVDPSRSLKRATAYIDGAAAPNGFRRSTDATGIDPLSTALGMQARIQLGWPREQPALTAYVAELSKAGPATNGRFYLSFLQSQTMREAGGASWPAWNTALRDHLVNTQQTTGHAAGSWSSTHAEARQGGRLYCTALGALILEVYYRTAPVYP
jgi:hypothetical protein